MELETCHRTIPPSGQAPKVRNDQEAEKHFPVRFFRQAIWFLSGEKRSGHPKKDAWIGFTGAPYRTKLGTPGKKRFLSNFFA